MFKLINNRSKKLFEQAQKVIPGGVNSPVRAFKSVGGTPIFIKNALGAYLIDEDGNKYLDFVGSWGPMVLGHSNKNIVNAIKNQASKGISFGAPTKNELEIAKIIKESNGFLKNAEYKNDYLNLDYRGINSKRISTSGDII